MITIAIGVIMCISYILIATEHKTHINKAATAMFAGVVGWILFMLTDTQYISTLHAEEWVNYLGNSAPNWKLVHEFIAQNVFMRHASYICSLVMYLLATMAIVDVLISNECFVFLKNILRNRSSLYVLWTTVAITFIISVNLDNLTTTLLMILLMKKIVANDRQRIYIGAAIVVAANCGGCCTVIGDITSLMIWYKGAVTPANFSGAMLVPAILATATTTSLIARKLPTRIELVRQTVFFRGDDSYLPIWQRSVLFIIGLGGLWFIPTFTRITLLPPFLGALCVLCLLWVLNEVFNHARFVTDQPNILSAGDHRLLYESLQVIMYVIGICLAVDVMIECGVLSWVRMGFQAIFPNIYIMGAVFGILSAFIDNIILALTGMNLYSVVPDGQAVDTFQSYFMQNGPYWHLILFCGAMGGCLLPIGNTAGYAFIRLEDEAAGKWYFKHIFTKVLAGWIVGLLAYFVIDYFIR